MKDGLQTPPEKIIKKLRKAATLPAGGQGIEEVCKKLEVRPPTYHRWRQEYGGAKEETVKLADDALIPTMEIKRDAFPDWIRKRVHVATDPRRH